MFWLRVAQVPWVVHAPRKSVSNASSNNEFDLPDFYGGVFYHSRILYTRAHASDSIMCSNTIRRAPEMHYVSK